MKLKLQRSSLTRAFTGSVKFQPLSLARRVLQTANNKKDNKRMGGESRQLTSQLAWRMVLTLFVMYVQRQSTLIMLTANVPVTARRLIFKCCHFG